MHFVQKLGTESSMSVIIFANLRITSFFFLCSVDGKNVFVFVRFVVETDDKSKQAIPVLLVLITGPNKVSIQFCYLIYLL